MHVQNGARRQLRALGESPGTGGRMTSAVGGHNRGLWRPVGTRSGRARICRAAGLRGRGCRRGCGVDGDAAACCSQAVGIIPPLADSFHQRPETGLDLRAGLYPGDTVVLTHAEDSPAAPATQGGTGKTQLAVAFTHALWATRAVEALVWVPAQPGRDLTGFAQAAGTVGAAAPGAVRGGRGGPFHQLAGAHPPAVGADPGRRDQPGRPERPVARGPGWAGCHHHQAAGGCLPGGAGWCQGRGGGGGGGGPRIAPVGGFSRREVLAYLGARRRFPDERAEALELGEELDGLPLAFAQAAAVMSVNQLSCRDYRVRLGERREHMSAIRVDGVSPACWLPGRWRWSARTTCRRRAWPGRPSRWPPCWTRTAYPAPC